MPNRRTVSVVMPVWNRAGFVARAVGSVIAQTFDDWELVVVDDGSRDDTAGALAPLLRENVRLVRRPHRGVGAARNAGLALSDSAYVAYLDSDNAWHPEFLETMLRAVREREGARAAYCMFNVLKRDPETGDVFHARVRGEPFDLRKLLKENTIDLNTFVHARECLGDSIRFDERLRRLVDWDFILRIAARYEPVYVPKALVDYYSGTAQNAITYTESLERARRTVARKFAAWTAPVAVVHDTVRYRFDDLPPEKFANKVRVSIRRLRTGDGVAWGFPHTLQIEPTNRCNLACPLCPAGRGELNRERRHMRLSEYARIVDDMEKYLLFLILWDWGEPFMNPELPAMIRYAAERGIRTVTSTNAHFLNDEAYVREILSSGLSTLIVAIDSLDPEAYRAYRRGGNLDAALAGVERLIALKREMRSPTVVNMRMVVMRTNERELPAIRSLAHSLGADLFTAKTVNPSCGASANDAGMVPRNPFLRRYVYRPGTWERVRIDAACRRIWTMSNIFSNGDVVPCAYDYDASMKLGNVFETPFTRIWNGPAYRDLRLRVHSGKDSLPKCRDCGVNFKLSRHGWYIETADMNAAERLRYWTLRTARGIRARVVRPSEAP